MDVLHWFEFVALLFSLLSFHRRNPSELKLLLAVMLVTTLAESIGYYMRVYKHQSNHLVYNISVPLIILFLMILNLKLAKFQNQQKLSWSLIFFYLLFVFTNLLFIQGIKRFATYNYIVGGCLLTILTSFLFLELMRRPKYINLSVEPFFWIGSGIILMYLPKSILYTVFEYLSYDPKLKISFNETFSFLNPILSGIFYLSISIACSCRLIFRV